MKLKRDHLRFPLLFKRGQPKAILMESSRWALPIDMAIVRSTLKTSKNGSVLHPTQNGYECNHTVVFRYQSITCSRPPPQKKRSLDLICLLNSGHHYTLIHKKKKTSRPGNRFGPTHGYVAGCLLWLDRMVTGADGALPPGLVGSVANLSKRAFLRGETQLAIPPPPPPPPPPPSNTFAGWLS